MNFASNLFPGTTEPWSRCIVEVLDGASHVILAGDMTLSCDQTWTTGSLWHSVTECVCQRSSHSLSLTALSHRFFFSVLSLLSAGNDGSETPHDGSGTSGTSPWRRWSCDRWSESQSWTKRGVSLGRETHGITRSDLLVYSLCSIGSRSVSVRDALR